MSVATGANIEPHFGLHAEPVIETKSHQSVPAEFVQDSRQLNRAAPFAITLALAAELTSRTLSDFFELPPVAASSLNLVACVLLGTTAAFIVIRAHGARHVQIAISLTAVCLVLSGTIVFSQDMGVWSGLTTSGGLEGVTNWAHGVLLLVGTALLLWALYAALLETLRARYCLQQQAETLKVDIIEREGARRALSESEGRYRALFDQANDVVYVHDLAGRLISVNKAWERISGYSVAETVGLGVDVVIAPEYLALARAMTQRKLAGLPSSIYEVEIVAKDGRRIPVEVSSRLLYENGRPVAVHGVARDISDRKEAQRERERLESQLRHSQKLEGLGLLAGGVAHDFNNLLVAVLGYSDLALEDDELSPSTRNSLDQIKKASLRAADLVHQMLVYAGKAQPVIEPVCINDVVEEMADLLASALSRGVTLRRDFAECLPAVEADPTQIRQVLMNLITNAGEAIEGGAGTVTVSTGLGDHTLPGPGEGYLYDDLPAGPYVYVRVSDTGSGMDQEVRERIFDPFFTTKYKGRGLGLAAVLGIVRAHRGAIRLDTEPGRGTTFELRFPASSRNASSDKQIPAEEVAWEGGATILVVDDEDMVRATAKSILERKGCEVLEAEDGEEAVVVFKRHHPRIGAVLLDLTMPKMGGEETFLELRRVCPGARVILSSGYSDGEVAERLKSKGLAGFIQKPYRTSELLVALKTAMADT